MGKKNIKPSINQPVIRTNVAKATLLSWTTTSAIAQSEGVISQVFGPRDTPNGFYLTSYDGDDAE